MDDMALVVNGLVGFVLLIVFLLAINSIQKTVKRSEDLLKYIAAELAAHRNRMESQVAAPPANRSQG